MELDKAPRRYLLFIFFNVISWQCIVGPVLILLARKVAMPPSWVGFLISFLPLSTLMVVLTVPLVTRLGSKRLMMTTWLVRNCLASTVFLMPWAMGLWGKQAGWLVLLTATLAFCIVRAIGSGAWFPWLHEVVPEAQRGRYFSAEASVTQAVSVAVAFGQGFYLRGDPNVNHYLVIYGVGISSGLFSLLWMSRVPGGRAIPQAGSPWASFGAYKSALSDFAFLRFVATAALCFSALAWTSASLVMFMRDALGLSSRSIMLIMATGSGGILLTIRAWGRFADHSGSGHAMFLSLTGHALTVCACALLRPHAPWAAPLMVPLVILFNIFNAAYVVAANRAMLNLVREEGRIAYTSLWTMGTALALGATPVAAGIVIDAYALWGFRTCFLVSALAGLAGGFASLIFVTDGLPFRRTMTDLLNPVLPVRTVARIIWITAGMHPSNRPGKA